jgi:hypothetical protein
MTETHYLCKHGLSTCAHCGTDDDRAAFAHDQQRTPSDNLARAVFWNAYGLAMVAVVVHYAPSIRQWLASWFT